ncbi:hypothetical protein T484DRAFT_1823742 [Baffinella frigidus]|nr:hypothetical protein T484DRAFT_1823742 [Cryptophyta sp. CCMP2293]
MLLGPARVALLICAALGTADALRPAAPLLRLRPHLVRMSDSCEDGVCGVPGKKQGGASAGSLGLRGGGGDAVVIDALSTYRASGGAAEVEINWRPFFIDLSTAPNGEDYKALPLLAETPNGRGSLLGRRSFIGNLFDSIVVSLGDRLSGV